VEEIESEVKEEEALFHSLSYHKTSGLEPRGHERIQYFILLTTNKV